MAVGSLDARVLDALRDITRVQEIRDEFAEDANEIFESNGGIDGLRGIIQACDPDDRLKELKTVLETRFIHFLMSQRHIHLIEFDNESEDNLKAALSIAAPAWLKLQLEGHALPHKCAPSGSYPDDLYYLYVMIASMHGKIWFEADADYEEDDEANSYQTPCGRRKRNLNEALQACNAEEERRDIVSNMLEKGWKWNNKHGKAIRYLFYQALYKELQADDVQFQWGLCVSSLRTAAVLYNSTGTG